MKGRKSRGGRMRTEAAAYLSSLRISRNWTQRELQERAGLSPQYLSKVETGSIAISSDNIEQLATAYELTSLQKDEVLALAAGTCQLDTVNSVAAVSSDNVTRAECAALYALLALPKESAERAIEVYRAYAKVSDSVTAQQNKQDQ